MNFILEIVDSQTGCIVADYSIKTCQQGDIAEVLTIPDYNPDACYGLEKADIHTLGQTYALALEGTEEQGYLRARHWLDDLSYKVHTGRELLLMRSGLKPLAVFSEWEATEQEAFFDPLVEQGLFTKQAYLEPAPSASLPANRLTLYALPEEAWRIQAYLLMRRAARQTGWNETLERMEGLLLGYTEAQNDEFIHLRKASMPPIRPA
ncbi:hypothetical protein [Leeia aquatica]|uniref:Uncharacterized protein n=1 Tax=Leeia aquatica TaxID=2725557 RepID=A0A847S438_9NEIS|nr:hypothetical protein [Leeia aquatica]NLR74563.1 hypothetical protein [Leeia aquatica]